MPRRSCRRRTCARGLGASRRGSSLTAGASAGGGAIGLRAHQRGDSRLITGEALHTQRVKARRSREALALEARRDAASKVATAAKIANRGLSGELVRSVRDGRLRKMFEMLDAASEGVIDGAALASKLPSLPSDIAAALTPLVRAVVLERPSLHPLARPGPPS